MSSSQYDVSEIKHNIDEAVQLQMFNSNEDVWGSLVELQARLYEQFGIEE